MFSFLLVPHQAPLSMEFSRQEYWSRLPFPPPGDLPDPRIEPLSLMSPALAGGFLTTSVPWEALLKSYSNQWSLLPYIFTLPPLPVLSLKPIMKLKNSALKKKKKGPCQRPTPITLSPLSPSFHFKFLKGMPYVLGVSNPLFPITHNLVSVPSACWKWLEFFWQK